MSSTFTVCFHFTLHSPSNRILACRTYPTPHIISPATLSSPFNTTIPLIHSTTNPHAPPLTRMEMDPQSSPGTVDLSPPPAMDRTMKSILNNSGGALNCPRLHRFVNEHTEINAHVPLLEECPICLENYSTEPCVRIIGIEGCSHLVGLHCLKTMLRSHPMQEKRCPLCRATWIKAATRNGVPVTAAEMFEADPPISEEELFERVVASFRHEEELILRRNPSIGPSLPRIVNPTERNNSMRSPILLDSDYEADDDDLETRFEEFNRDVENIRSRAGRDQIRWGRHQTAEPDRTRSHSRSADSTAPAAPDVAERENVAKSFFERLRGNGSSSSSTPVPARSFTPTRSLFQNSSANPIHRSYTVNHGHNRYRHRRQSPSLETNPASEQAQVSRPSVRFATPPHTPADVEMNGVPEPVRLLSRSEIEAVRVQQRRVQLETRERQIVDHETLLAQRESNLVHREHRIAQLITRQQVELQALLRTHAAALERVLH